MFIPDKINSFGFNLELFSSNSNNAEDIAMDVSLIVPINPIIIIELANGTIFIPTL